MDMAGEGKMIAKKVGCIRIGLDESARVSPGDVAMRDICPGIIQVVPKSGTRGRLSQDRQAPTYEKCQQNQDRGSLHEMASRFAQPGVRSEEHTSELQSPCN